MKHKKKRKIPKPKIKALIFDIGGVIIFYDNMIAARKISKLINVPVKKIFNILDNPKSKFTNSYEFGSLPSVYWSIMAKELGVKRISTKKFAKSWTSIFWPNKELIFLVKKLKKNYKVGLISNMGKLHEKYLSQKYKLRDFFPVRVFSYKVKSRKPSSKIFRVILKKLKAKPEEVIFVDDRNENIKPAKKLGMKTVLFKNNKQTIKEIEKLLK